MSRQQHASTFVIPEPDHAAKGAPTSKGKRDAKPFVIVPEELVVNDDKLEPHWLPAIESATD